MAAVLDAVPQTTETRAYAQALKIVAMFSGVGLAVSLIVATYGLDLSWGFF
jgi:hypothetical protein